MDRSWAEKIQEAKTTIRPLITDGRWIEKRYRLLNGMTKTYRGATRTGDFITDWYNVLYSITETLKPMLYDRPPQPYAERRFHDKDPAGKAACEMLERVLAYEISASGFDEAMRAAVLDRLLAGIGNVWITHSYEHDGVAGWDATKVTPVLPRDMLFSPQSRTWDGMPWIARRIYMSERGFKDFFGGGELFKRLKNAFSSNPQDLSGDTDQEDKTTIGDTLPIWEIWDRETATRRFVPDSMPDITIAEEPVPMDLQGFYPCPAPLMAVTTPSIFLPTPDYLQYQRQAQELEFIEIQLGQLTTAIRAYGLYDAKYQEIATRLLTDSRQNDLIPVEIMGDFSNSGGLQNLLQFVDITPVITAIQGMEERKKELIDTIYQITGISDILRGQSDADETATAQGIKGNFGSLRMKDKQDAVAKFACGIIRIQAEIISKYYDTDNILKISGYNLEMDENAQEANAGLELLKTGGMREFRINVSTETIVAADEQAEKQARSDLLDKVTGFLQQYAQAPVAMMPFLSQLLLFVVRSYKSGRELEDSLESALNAMQEQAQAQQQSQQQGGDGQGGAQVQIHEQAPAPLQPKDLLNARTDIQRDLIVFLGKLVDIKEKKGLDIDMQSIENTLGSILAYKVQE